MTQTRREFVLTTVGSIVTVGFAGACRRLSVPEIVPAPLWGSATADPSVRLESIEFGSDGDRVPAFLSRPARSGRFPAVVVLHANWLVEPYIPDTTAMLAQAGFVGLAIDLFHMFPRVQTWEQAQKVPGSAMQAALNREFRESRMVRNIQSGIDYLQRQSFVESGGIGILGFCGGGWNALITSAQLRDITGVVAFYAPLAISDAQHRSPMELVSYIRAPVLFHQALKDPWVKPAEVDAFEKVLVGQGTPFQRFQYDAFHGFFAYNRAPEFSAPAASLAWQRTVPFLRAHAGGRIQDRPVAPRRVEVGSSDDESTSHQARHLLHHSAGR
jgi:carboxymethylenebutenolidase